MHDPSPTNPGLIYDPRHQTTKKFFAELEKALGQQTMNKMRGPTAKRKDFHKSVPLEKMTGPIRVNPRYAPYFKAGATFAVRV